MIWLNMKILFIINSLKSKSGSERVACTLANLLNQKLGYSIYILNRDTLKNEVSYDLDSNIDVIKVSGSIFQFSRKINGIISNISPDYVVVHNMGKLTLLYLILKIFNRGYHKLVSLEHGSFVGRPIFIKLLSKVLYRKVETVVSLTNSDKKSFEKFHGNVVVIPNISPYPPKCKAVFPKVILSVGRLDDNKNHIALLKSWELIQSYIHEWQLHIYGHGELKEYLQSYIDKNTLKNVYLKGVSDNISDVYENASIMCLTSKYEGLPMVLLEAQSFGLPIVSYDCPYGPSDVVMHGYNGYLIENNNIYEFSKYLLQFIDNPNQLEQFSKNSLIVSEKFQSDHIISIWMNKVFKV